MHVSLSNPLLHFTSLFSPRLVPRNISYSESVWDHFPGQLEQGEARDGGQLLHGAVKVPGVCWGTIPGDHPTLLSVQDFPGHFLSDRKW